MKGLKRWVAMVLIAMVTLGMPTGGGVFATGPAVLDQEQAVTAGNVFFNADYSRFQTFTPAITGNLSQIDLNIDGSVGSPGLIKVSLYKEGDLSTPLATALSAGQSAGWVPIDFSGTLPYLKRETMYRMVVSTEYGGVSNGYAWYMSGGNVYTRGSSSAFGHDFSFRTYMIGDYSTSPSESLVSRAHSSLVADGVSQTTISVKLKDAQGTDLTTGGATVTILSTLGTVGVVTDHNNGTYTATLTAPVTVGTAAISAYVSGIPITATTSVQFVPGAPSPATSTVEAGVAALTADGTSQTTVSVKLKDAQGNNLTTGGAAVAIASTLGTVGAVTNHNNGTYTATLTAPVTVGSGTISASVGGSTLAATASVQFVPGASSPVTSTIEAGDAALAADGTSQTTVSVKLKDAQGNALTTGGAAVTIASTLGAVGAVTDHNNGTYTATLTAPVTVGTGTISASVGGSALAATASVQFVPGAPSPATSTVETGVAALTADGTSQTTVSVKLKDAQGNALTTGGATVVIVSTLGTVGAVTDHNNGTYTATLTAPVTVGAGTISASVGGSTLAATASVQFVPGAPSPATSTVETGDAALTADGTSQTTVSVKLKDAQGNALTTGGATVVIVSTLGTVGAVTDHNNGTYTATLTAPVTVGAGTISASVGGSEITATTSVQFVPGASSPVTSTVETGDAALTADGTSQTTVSVKLKDVQGNALTTGGSTVVIASTLGAVGAVTDHNNGTYTATLTAPVTVGSGTISASVGGSTLAATASVQFVPGASSAATSTLTVDEAVLTADGTSQTTVSVKLKDAQGNNLTTGGAAVAIASTLGAVGAVTDHNNGTYTATLTAPVTVGTGTISASVGGSTLAATASVQFVPGASSAATSTLTVDEAVLTADGTSQMTVSVKLKDAQGNDLTTGGATVVIASTLGAVGTVTDHNNGTYTAMLTAPVTVGTGTISASVGGSTLAATTSVQFAPGVPSSATSTLTVGDATLTADGKSQTTVSVKLKDAQGNDLTIGGATVVIGSTLGAVGAVTDHNNGTYTATLTAPVTIGTAAISASIGGSAIGQMSSVQFVPGEVSASRSAVTATDLVVRADGSSKASIFVKLKDDYDHPLIGKRVQLQANGGRSVIDTVYGLTNAEGMAAFAVSNTAAEKVTYFAKEEASGLSLDQTVDIAFTYDQPPVIRLQADPVGPTFGSVTVSVTASVYGEFNSVSAMKWAAGSRPISYFDTQGAAMTDHFTVQENGIYSVYAADAAGNANVSMIEVQNIVPLSSDSSLSGWQLSGAGGMVKFDFDPGTTSYSAAAGHSVYGLKMLLATSNAYSIVRVNGLQVTSNSFTDEYALATGKNTFEVSVTAQDGSVKKYTLEVIRAAASANSDPISPPGDSSASNWLAMRINDREVSGISSFQRDASGASSIDVLLNRDTLIKVLESTSAATDWNLSVAIENEADTIILRLSGEAVALLAEKTAAITLKTKHGQYRLPLAEIANQGHDWTNGGEAQITIEQGSGEASPDLQEAADKGGFRLVGDPVHFTVNVVRNGESREIASFSRYVERVIYLPKDAAGTASTAVVWDRKLGVHPVPTEFTEVDGHQAAVIRSLTNSTYVLVSRTPQLTDIQGHWAAAEIEGMNRRMIVNGVDGSRFAPEAVITRAELAALLARALGLPGGGEDAAFRDVSESSWYSGAIAAVKAYGIIDGFKDGTFGPNREVSRQEAIVMIIRALRLANAATAASSEEAQADLDVFADRNQIGVWASDAIRTAIAEGLVKGYGDELRPRESLTRAETTVLIHRMLLKAGLIDS
ncbi:S-layer homology domain-containing protein [Paenibacillus oenotherae]|uniref:S-layer homology domain-containing protein n=1 Tax=Paenibacillus oenotherae TaxID=1435645 RepID=A0ABS7D6S9_9BACL|nr:invasin domain 3-containing protein [Paenibacillus oenotherae]MBW7475600.1 S-layer homology domain-containing protein [Paenibacillus oenotherae]